jgi:hypothetical protein
MSQPMCLRCIAVEERAGAGACANATGVSANAAITAEMGSNFMWFSCGYSLASTSDAPRDHIQAERPPTPTNKVDCEKAKMKWEEKGGKDGKGACVAAAPAAKDAVKK